MFKLVKTTTYYWPPCKKKTKTLGNKLQRLAQERQRQEEECRRRLAEKTFYKMLVEKQVEAQKLAEEAKEKASGSTISFKKKPGSKTEEATYSPGQWFDCHGHKVQLVEINETGVGLLALMHNGTQVCSAVTANYSPFSLMENCGRKVTLASIKKNYNLKQVRPIDPPVFAEGNRSFSLADDIDDIMVGGR